MSRGVMLLILAMASLSAKTFYVTVAGLGGEPDYEQRFVALANEADKLFRLDTGASVVTLTGAKASRDGLLAALRSVGSEARSSDAVVITLIGHGTFDGEYKLNLVGPDLTAHDLAVAVDAIQSQKVLLVNTTSASGGGLEELSKANRVVITATRSGTEKNAPVFARYWVDALRGGAADKDKNDVVTAQEAFAYATAKVKAYYEDQKRVATEHAVLDKQGELLAGRLAVVQGAEVAKLAQDPAKQKLLVRREELEKQIDDLKLQKAALPTEQYRSKLSAMLLELAKIQAEIDK